MLKEGIRGERLKNKITVNFTDEEIDALKGAETVKEVDGIITRLEESGREIMPDHDFSIAKFVKDGKLTYVRRLCHMFVQETGQAVKPADADMGFRHFLSHIIEPGGGHLPLAVRYLVRPGGEHWKEDSMDTEAKERSEMFTGDELNGVGYFQETIGRRLDKIQDS